MILALNAGSSSVKFGVYADGEGDLACTLRGRTQVKDGRLAVEATDRAGRSLAADLPCDDRPEAALLAWIEGRREGGGIDLVGHRVVHGGTDFSAPVRIDAGVLDRLDALMPLAPLHQPASLAPIRRLREARPGLAQVACFDTAFHRTIGSPADRLPIPRAWHDRGVRRYGFHGLSYEAIAARLAARRDGAEDQRIVVAHLGSGASLCALAGLRSVDTTMGFTALDGIMMGTRPGSLDPGVLLHLLRHHGFDAARLERWLYHECGLAGVSGLSSDMAELTRSGDHAAREAVDLFCLAAAKGVAAMATTLGGCDRLVFTGGIGQHAAPVRAGIAGHLRWLGAALDEEANGAGRTTISADGSRLLVQVIATDEERAIAGHARDAR